MRSRPRTSLLAGLAALAAATLVAQPFTGGLSGRVIDERESPIPVGSATLSGPTAPRVASLDDQGGFRFLQVPPGRYTLHIEAPGFAAVVRDDVGVSAGRTTQLEVFLPVAGVAQDVVVQDDTPLVDARKVATGQSFEREQLREIPTARDIWSLAQQVPGVQLDSVNVAGNASATIGGPSLINRGSGNVIYAVDGATITDNFYGFGLNRQNGGTAAYFDFGSIEDLEVVTGGSALDQQSSGVTINVVTKRGTNTLHGSGRFLYASDDWQSNNTPESMVAAGLQSNDTRFIREYGAELGGPLLEDRLWLWASAARQDISLSPTTFSPGEIPIPETTRLTPWSAKLNSQLSSANALTAYFQRSDRLASGLEIAPDRPPETRLDREIPSDFYKLEDSHVFSSDLFAAVFASYLDAANTSTPIGGLDRDKQYYDGSFHNSWEYLRGTTAQKQANLQLSRFFDAGATSHEVKFGFNYRLLDVESASGLPGSQNYGNSDEGFAELTSGKLLTWRTEYWTGTLGDTMTAGNLTLSAGVRFDLQRGRNLPGRSLGNAMFADPCPSPECGDEGFPGLPPVRYHGSEAWQIDFSDWQPRISATYGLGKSRSTLLRASYARYADQLGWVVAFLNGIPFFGGYSYGWNDLNGDHDVQRNEINWNDDRGVVGFDPATLPDLPNRIAPDFRLASSDEVTAGVEQSLGADLAVSATFSYRNTDDLQFPLPVGAGPSTWTYGGQATGTANGFDGFTLHFDEPYYDLALPEAPAGQEAVNRPGASQRYLGVDLSIVKRLSDNWMVRANAGWSSFRQFLTPQSIQNPNNLWSAGGQNDDGGLATGVSPKPNVWLNAGWQFNVSGLYQGPWGLTFGANVYGRQGYPLPYFVTVQTDDVATSSWDLLIDEVDTFRYPDVYQVDLRLQKEFAVGPVTLTPAVELFNATNANALLNAEGKVGDYFAAAPVDCGDGVLRQFCPSGGLNSPIEIQSPRIVRLGIQLSF